MHELRRLLLMAAITNVSVEPYRTPVATHAIKSLDDQKNKDEKS